MKKILFIYTCLLLTISAFAQQANFVGKGKITFERKINTFATMPIFLRETGMIKGDDVATFMQNYRNGTQFWTDTFDLYFDQTHSFYQPANPDIDFCKTFAVPVSYKNKVYNNFETSVVNIEKQAFENAYFISDTIRRLKWKLTDETREIAGFECHRANALVFDSIYIVAFYTDQIPTKSGPETFNGLPGMILGIAIPHQHITIFAQSVTGVNTEPQQWAVPVAGKRTTMDNKAFNTMTMKLLKQFNLSSAWVQFFMDL
ncbi:GLPGLI family protein [Chitinophaga jiangningensis]|uniref:GLPGLI family protein n=1 Tax=Chitinophaga jiangningensis TaxID=1419482 RepID=A0A1M7K8H8_9BACT|nr:GLPGLI family protein [Chitinophaga jiangningensis]SHM61592.1 GLPGLI family protein [Chitinophaga jiangningensis]